MPTRLSILPPSENGIGPSSVCIPILTGVAAPPQQSWASWPELSGWKEPLRQRGANRQCRYPECSHEYVLPGCGSAASISDIPHIRQVYERLHQDEGASSAPLCRRLGLHCLLRALTRMPSSKGVQYMKESGTPYWEVPYLPIDPADVGREYEPIIRINSQSGKEARPLLCSRPLATTCPRRCTRNSAPLLRLRAIRPAVS